jgi:hypothetical protein
MGHRERSEMGETSETEFTAGSKQQAVTSTRHYVKRNYAETRGHGDAARRSGDRGQTAEFRIADFEFRNAKFSYYDLNGFYDFNDFNGFSVLNALNPLKSDQESSLTYNNLRLLD